MIRKYLSQQYPYEENKWKIILPVSIFVTFFMVIFQPFGLSEYQGNSKMIILAGFGLVTFIILVFNMIALPLLFPGTFREEKWTIVKELLFFLLILFTIGLGNLIYSIYFFNMKVSFSALMVFQAFTIAIGIIPITALTLIKHSYLNRRNTLSAEKITHDIKPIPIKPEPGKFLQIFSESGKEEIVIEYSDLVFIKSDGNYITVGYMKNGRFTRSLVRNTMKFAEDILAPFPSGFKCHRSWLVNLDKIVRVTGNSQGLKLELAGCEEPVPVARNLAADFKRIMLERNG